MFLHVRLPGFHALVHQVQTPSLRRRPVVVATDRGDQAPLLACSPEAYGAGIDRRLRVSSARQRCAEIVVCLPDQHGARRLQADVAAAALEITPLVASGPGHWVVDLRGSESFWSSRLIRGQSVTDPMEQACLLAERIHARIQDDLALTPRIGVAARPLAAFLATRLADLAQPPRNAIVPVPPSEEAGLLDLLPVHHLPISTTLKDHLVFLHCHTIGDVRRLGTNGLRTLAGATGAVIAEQLLGDEHLLPASLDPAPSCLAEATLGESAHAPRDVLAVLTSLAQQVGERLRRYHVAATTLSLTVRWGPGSTRHSSIPTGYQVREDRDLAHLAEHLLVSSDISEPSCAWMRLVASGLCAAEDQQDLFRLQQIPWKTTTARPLPTSTLSDHSTR